MSEQLKPQLSPCSWAFNHFSVFALTDRPFVWQRVTVEMWGWNICTPPKIRAVCFWRYGINGYTVSYISFTDMWGLNKCLQIQIWYPEKHAVWAWDIWVLWKIIWYSRSWDAMLNKVAEKNVSAKFFVCLVWKTIMRITPANGQFVLMNCTAGRLLPGVGVLLTRVQAITVTCRKQPVKVAWIL